MLISQFVGKFGQTKDRKIYANLGVVPITNLRISDYRLIIAPSPIYNLPDSDKSGGTVYRQWSHAVTQEYESLSVLRL